jgi:hypothetical protein
MVFTREFRTRRLLDQKFFRKLKKIFDAKLLIVKSENCNYGRFALVDDPEKIESHFRINDKSNGEPATAK